MNYLIYLKQLLKKQVLFASILQVKKLGNNKIIIIPSCTHTAGKWWSQDAKFRAWSLEKNNVAFLQISQHLLI